MKIGGNALSKGISLSTLSKQVGNKISKIVIIKFANSIIAPCDL